MRTRRPLSAAIGGLLFLTFGSPAVIATASSQTAAPAARPAAPPPRPSPTVVTTDPVTGFTLSVRAGVTGLTAPATGAPADLAQAWARANAKDFGLTPGQARNLFVAKALPLTSGSTAVHLGQRAGGLRIKDAVLTVLVAADGRILSASGDLASGSAKGGSNVRLTARQALDSAAGTQGARPGRRLNEADTTATGKRSYANVYGKGTSADRPVTAELVWVPSDHGRTLTLAWLTDIEASGTSWYETAVDASTGAVLSTDEPLRPRRRRGHGQPDPAPRRRGRRVPGDRPSRVSTARGSPARRRAATTSTPTSTATTTTPTTSTSPTTADQHFNYTFTDAWRTTANSGSAR